MSDVIVVGLGADGSAAAAELARRGERVLGIEAFPRGHTLGSSGGLTRVIRLAYYEHPDYVPLLRRAWERWRELERDQNVTLLNQVGGLCIGPRDGRLVAGCVRSAVAHGLDYELLSPDALHARWPAFEMEKDWWAVAEPNAGYLFPERCIEAHTALAERSGATLRFETRVNSVTKRGAGVRVVAGGEAFDAERAVVTAGAWNDRLLPQLAGLLHVDRVPLFWFEPVSHKDELARLPVYIVDGEHERGWYGFPYLADQGLKAAPLGSGVRCDPDTVDRTTTEADVAPVIGALRRYLPWAAGELRSSKVCMYTISPDEHFVVGTDGPITYASACSGHGFKFSSVMGEVLADLAMTGRSRQDIAFLSRARFAA